MEQFSWISAIAGSLLLILGGVLVAAGMDIDWALLSVAVLWGAVGWWGVKRAQRQTDKHLDVTTDRTSGEKFSADLHPSLKYSWRYKFCMRNH